VVSANSAAPRPAAPPGLPVDARRLASCPRRFPLARRGVVPCAPPPRPWLSLSCTSARRYGSNIGVLLLNKYLLSIFGFKCPVFLTLCHMLACSCMSYAVAASRCVPLQAVKSRRQFYKISLLALIFCLTVVLGNVSLRFIPVSFNQVRVAWLRSRLLAAHEAALHCCT
jgi:hypothetical protein